MRTILFVAILFPLLFPPTSASAELKPGTKKAMEKEARSACLMGDYQKGTELLVNLFVETKTPVYIHNQARCFEQNHRWEEAIDRFREYLRTAPQLPEGERAEVEKHIAECDGHLAKQTSTIAPPPTVTSPQPIPPPPPPPIETKGEASPLPARQDPSGSAMKIAGITTGAVGLASVGVGLYFYFHHESLVKDLKAKGASYSDKQFSDKQQEINTSKTWGWVGFGVGAAALITGTTLYLLGSREAQDVPPSTKLSLLPVIGDGQTTLMLAGVF